MHMHNPKLSYLQRVRLKDGREAVVSDKADHRKSRTLDIEGELEMKVIKVTEIVAAHTSIHGWVDCTWD